MVKHSEEPKCAKLLIYGDANMVIKRLLHQKGKIKFSGKYGADLINEIFNYALVAESIALQNDFDIIHAHDWLAYPAGIAAKKATGKPLVIHVHATDFDRSGGSVNPQVFEIEKMGMDAADRIITGHGRKSAKASA